MRKLLLLFVLSLFLQQASAQTYYQYFDGADTLTTSIIVNILPDSNHVWQIGRPQKIIFNSAATLPNAIVTDTINHYPVNDTSSFIVSTRPYWTPYIYAYQWKQKLDLDKKHDGAIVEFSVDSGATWQNAFHNAHVYNFYGFDPANADTLPSGQYAFTGTDTAWRDIWLCIGGPTSVTTDSMLIRFTLITDSIDSNKEGWLIDNMMAHPTWIHTATKMLKEIDHISVYPTITSGAVTISTKKQYKLKEIQRMELFDAGGKMLQEYSDHSLNQTIDLSGYADGIYILKIKSNLGSDTHKLVLKK